MKWLFFTVLFFLTCNINARELLLHDFFETENNDNSISFLKKTITLQTSNPLFADIPTEVCLNSSYVLPTVSDGSVTGSWSPVLDTSILGSEMYTFTPDSGQEGEIITRNITVTTSIIPVFNTIFPMLCENSSFVLPAVSDNLITGSWSSELDTSILGNGSYTFVPDTGQCGEIITYSITVAPSVNSLFSNIPEELCVDTSYVLPTISDNLIEGSWFPVLDTSVVGSTMYTFTPDAGQCGGITTRNITVNFSSINPIFNSVPEELCIDTSYVLPIVSDNSITGSWFPILDTSITGSVLYTFTPDTDQCGISVTRTIEIIDFKEIMIPIFFTPNNDGINDYWKIEGLENMQNIRVSIFDRYGKLLNNYDPEIGWNGFYNGVRMPPNDYWYLIEGEDSSCKTIKRKGHFSLLKK